MKLIPTEIQGLYVIEKEPRIDERGTFARVFAMEELKRESLDFTIVHINQGFSNHKGTLRGLHYQTTPKEEIKLFQCVNGTVFDVVVDMREDSSTYRKWYGIELSEDNNKMLYIPKGFAHGYQTLTDNCRVEYFVSEYYAPEFEKGVGWNDPSLGIKWPIPNPILSPKDQEWPPLT